MSSSKSKASTKDRSMSAFFGNGGETHQQTDGSAIARMTTQQGVPIADDQNSLKIGYRGPAALQDFVMREKIFHFDHERIPERVVHARGYGAHGYFESYDDLSELTCASVFESAGKKTPLFARFSTVAGSAGSPDLARDVRGFAVKMYSDEGNWDLVGNNIPVFFIQDAMKFPDLIHAAKAEPDRGFPQAQTAHDNFWDFISLMPESMHMVMWAMSDRAIPRSLRTMEGFGVHTFRLLNAQGESTYVKFHWKPKAGLQSVLWNEAMKINGADPDFHRRDLWNAIQSGDYPEWELGLQLFDDEFADKFDFDVLDATKLIPEELLPIRIVGKMVLNRCVDNFFAETEQVAFCTQNVIPGIDFTNDPLLQGRNFSYLDTQTKRLGGPNFTHIPINAPRCPMHHFQQDGHMAMHNPVGRANYEPNSWPAEQAGPRETPTGFRHFQVEVSGQSGRPRAESFADHYSQARQFFISQTETEQSHIRDALVFELSKVKTTAIRERLVSHLLHIDNTLANQVANRLGLKIMPEPAATNGAAIIELEPAESLSILKNPPDSIRGRKLGIFVMDGCDMKLLRALQSSAEDAGVNVELIAPSVGGFECSEGMRHEADEKIDGGPSVLYDFVAVLAAEASVDKMCSHTPAKDFVSDAFAHCKFIAYTSSAARLMNAAGVSDFDDQGLQCLENPDDAVAYFECCRAIRHWAREDRVFA